MNLTFLLDLTMINLAFLNSKLSATALIGLFKGFKLVITISNLSFSILIRPFCLSALIQQFNLPKLKPNSLASFLCVIFFFFAYLN